MTQQKQLQIWTIGHSTQDFEAFGQILAQNRISAVADVRSTPFSRYSPQFSRDALAPALHRLNIHYVFLGRELGARSDDPTCYENGKVQYRRLAESELFQSGLERVIRGASQHRVALMCAEKEPLDCHRTILIARELADSGVEVRHILADGSAEHHDETMRRLLRMLKMPEADLFRSREEILHEALSSQEAKIAYVSAQDNSTGEIP